MPCPHAALDVVPCESCPRAVGDARIGLTAGAGKRVRRTPPHRALHRAGVTGHQSRNTQHIRAAASVLVGVRLAGRQPTLEHEPSAAASHGRSSVGRYSDLGPRLLHLCHARRGSRGSELCVSREAAAVTRAVPQSGPFRQVVSPVWRRNAAPRGPGRGAGQAAEAVMRAWVGPAKTVARTYPRPAAVSPRRWSAAFHQLVRKRPLGRSSRPERAGGERLVAAALDGQNLPLVRGAGLRGTRPGWPCS